MGIEGRKHKRLPVDLLSRYEVGRWPENAPASLPAIDTPAIKDISMGGVKIAFDQRKWRNFRPFNRRFPV